MILSTFLLFLKIYFQLFFEIFYNQQWFGSVLVLNKNFLIAKLF